MKKLLFLLTFGGLFLSCEQAKNTEKIHENADGEITVGKNFVVDRPMAIVVSPTEEQLQDAKKIMGEDYQIFYGDGAQFLQEANQVLEQNKIETIDRLSNEIITFSTTEGKLHDVNLTDKSFAVLLFNGKDEPKDLEFEHLSPEFIQEYMK